ATGKGLGSAENDQAVLGRSLGRAETMRRAMLGVHERQLRSAQRTPPPVGRRSWSWEKELRDNCAPQSLRCGNVRSGSIATDAAQANTPMQLRLAPKADKGAAVSIGPLCARSGLMHRSKDVPKLQ